MITNKEVRISVNKTLTRKLIYVVAALTLLALLIPAMAVPVSAAPGGTLTMTVNGVTDGPVAGFPNEAFNASGSIVTITASPAPTSWAMTNVTSVYEDPIQYQAAQWYPNNVPPSPTATSVQIQGTWGEATVTATWASGDPVSVTKKWGMLHETIIGTPQTASVTWNEEAKAFYATGNITDFVSGDFVVNGQHVIMPMQNMKLNWYLIKGSTPVTMTPDLPANLITSVSVLANRAQYVQFVDKNTVGYNPWVHTSPGWLGTYVTNYSGPDGKAQVYLGAWFEEVVKVVVVPEYPVSPTWANRFVIPEVTSYSFTTYEYESVPQVRWVGEKIVLEANFGASYVGQPVKFYFQNQSVGALESITAPSGEAATVWTTVNSDGIASVILTSNVNGVSDVVAALYAKGTDLAPTNQHSFRVYFLNFYSLTLRDVNGKRAQHNAGDWTVANPYSNNFPGVASSDLLAQTANVSQDTLERAQVRGYFMPFGNQKSSRVETNIDLDADGSVLADHDMGDVVAPAGHYVLPDDWVYLMGSDPLRRLHWDIMDSPGDTVTATAALGPYTIGTVVVADAPVVGPFAPGIEKMTSGGWMVANPNVDNKAFGNPAFYPRRINTVVPNGVVNAWDAPMPPAKVVFEIQSGVGYFKDAWKTGIYYTGTGANKVYTEPFYQILIPAHWAIPPFNNEFGGGYDWNSYDGVHGNYEFWKVINQPTAGAPVLGDATHPTRVEVYSDNHGEAMTYLNGNFNLNLLPFDKNGAADIQPGYVVGNTVVRALADYPYIRTDQLILSNTVAKTWTWGGIVLGPDATHQYKPDQPTALFYTAGPSRMVMSSGTFTHITGTWPDEVAYSDKKAVWVWVTDRDGKQAGVLNARVQWNISVTSGTTPQISGVNSLSLNNYNGVTQNIGLTGGFLTGTNGLVTDLYGYQGVSWVKAPSASPVLGALDSNGKSNAPYVGKTALQALFYKFYNPTMAATGLQPDNFMVAMIEVKDMSGSTSGAFNVHTRITSYDFGLTGGAYGWLPGVNLGTVEYDTNCEFAFQDPIDDAPLYGDANLDGVVNMGDVTTIERMILGLAYANVNADANVTNSIDMGDVVKVERKILGY